MDPGMKAVLHQSKQYLLLFEAELQSKCVTKQSLVTRDADQKPALHAAFFWFPSSAWEPTCMGSSASRILG
jgi:hypothetical protein